MRGEQETSRGTEYINDSKDYVVLEASIGINCPPNFMGKNHNIDGNINMVLIHIYVYIYAKLSLKYSYITVETTMLCFVQTGTAR